MNSINFCKTIAGVKFRGRVALVECKQINTVVDLIYALKDQLMIPDYVIDAEMSRGGWKCFTRCMKNLEWIGSPEITIIFNDFNSIFESDPKDRERLLLCFEESIFPYWRRAKDDADEDPLFNEKDFYLLKKLKIFCVDDLSY